MTILKILFACLAYVAIAVWLARSMHSKMGSLGKFYCWLAAVILLIGIGVAL